MVDVRDCARAHIAALENVEARGRYICVNRTVWMKEIVDILAGNGYSGRDLPWRVRIYSQLERLMEICIVGWTTELGCTLTRILGSSWSSGSFFVPLRSQQSARMSLYQ